MQYIIHPHFGGFHVPAPLRAMYTPDSMNYGYFFDEELEHEFRTDPTAILWVQMNPECDLGVITIPDEATDWELDEYDGSEHVIAVVHGKLMHIRG